MEDFLFQVSSLCIYSMKTYIIFSFPFIPLTSFIFVGYIVLGPYISHGSFLTKSTRPHSTFDFWSSLLEFANALDDGFKAATHVLHLDQSCLLAAHVSLLLVFCTILFLISITTKFLPFPRPTPFFAFTLVCGHLGFMYSVKFLA